MPLPHRQDEHGFTLIETIIALTILSIAITGAVTLVQQGFRHLEKTRQHQQASYHAHNHLTRLKFDASIVAGNYSGHYSQEYQWALSLYPTAAVNEPTETAAYGLAADLVISFRSGQRRFHSLVIVQRKNREKTSTTVPNASRSIRSNPNYQPVNYRPKSKNTL